MSGPVGSRSRVVQREPGGLTDVLSIVSVWSAMNLETFLLLFVLLSAVCGVVIGMALWRPITDDRDSVAALLRRFEREEHERMPTTRQAHFPGGGR